MLLGADSKRGSAERWAPRSPGWRGCHWGATNLVSWSMLRSLRVIVVIVVFATARVRVGVRVCARVKY